VGISDVKCNSLSALDKLRLKKNMNPKEQREITRDSYDNKTFEIIRGNEGIFIYDYGLRRFLERGESEEVLKGLKEFQVK